MNILFSFFFAAGAAAFTYTKIGRRVGYGNSQSVWITVGVVFVIVFFVFFSLLTWVLHAH